mmetsp:Transcript_23622/g.41967  ORF Transcript_23622/g.41967 Transcript_23622/m.41967 type:complete len:303 (+) Transcript_23622:10-918(+)
MRLQFHVHVVSSLPVSITTDGMARMAAGSRSRLSKDTNKQLHPSAAMEEPRVAMRYVVYSAWQCLREGVHDCPDAVLDGGGVEGGWGGELDARASDGLIQKDVTARELRDELDGRLRQHFVLVRVAMVTEPEAEELLIDVLRALPALEPLLVGGGDPEAGGVGGVDLIDEHDGSVLELSKLVLSVNKDEAALGSLLLSKCKQLLGRARTHLEVRLTHEPLVHDAAQVDGDVAYALCGWCQQALGKLLRLLQPIGELVAAVVADAVEVLRLDGGLRASGHVAAHYKLNGENLGLLHDGDVRVG